jgi:ADP-ribose pyrophosphatase
MSFEHLGTETVWEGRVASVHVERFRHPDGAEVERERVGHPGAVAVAAHDDRYVYMVRQPREAVREAALLEVPAGKLDEEGESPLQTGKRELAEEIGKEAATWREATSYWSSPGFTDERIHVFVATDLSDAPEAEPAAGDEDERIEVVPWPLERLDELIDGCQDGKSLVALLWLRRLRSA